MKCAKHILFFLILIPFSVELLITDVTKGETADADLVVFAAGSTSNVIKEIGELYQTKGFGNIITSFASSSTLAQQIVSGASVDVYLSANSKWMDFLEKKGCIEKESRFNLLSNRIVLIAPLKSQIQNVSITKELDLSVLLGSDGRLAMGDPKHVPAGIYGKEAMQNLGLWEQVKNSLAPMKDVRAALVLVERAEVPLGQVYSTDVAISQKVRVVGLFPSASHSEIVYPVAAVTGSKIDMATNFLKFLKRSEAKEIFLKHGFEVR